MITYGFFNSLNGDRVYNADQMSTYFKGLIVSTGIYVNVGGALQVLADSGLSVNVQTGRALIDNKWVEVDAVEPISITTPHVTLNRYTAVVLQLDTSNREITLLTIDGENATNPIRPSITRSATIKQLCLAYIYVPAGATAITQANIIDTRADTEICGWITGLINQVDTSTLFLQWQNAYEQYFAQMESWKNTQESTFEAWEIAQKNAFDAWFAALTQELQVNTYIAEYNKMVTLSSSDSRDIALNMTGYTYNSSDIIFVFLNGLKATPGTDYTVDGTTPKITIAYNTFVGDVEIKILKSRIGWQ